MVARQHAELRRQVAALIGILELQQSLAGADPLDEGLEEQQPAQKQQQQPQQRLAAATPAQSVQQQGTHTRDLVRICLCSWPESWQHQRFLPRLATVPASFSVVIEH